MNKLWLLWFSNEKMPNNLSLIPGLEAWNGTYLIASSRRDRLDNQPPPKPTLH